MECVRNLVGEIDPAGASVVIGRDSKRDDGEVRHASDERGQRVEFGVGVPGVVADGDV